MKECSRCNKIRDYKMFIDGYNNIIDYCRICKHKEYKMYFKKCIHLKIHYQCRICKKPIEKKLYVKRHPLEVL